MRIVAIADTHLFHDRASLVRIPEGDVFVHAGDLCQYGSLDELARAADFFRALPHPVKVVVAGNHDVCLERTPTEARALLDGFVYLQDESAVIEGKVFYGSPWTVKHRIWAFGAPRGPEMAAKWAKMPDHVDVLVTHGPPWGFGDRIEWQGKLRHVGCVDLLGRLLKVSPSVHLFGHIHQDPGHWEEGPMQLYNVTTGDSARGATVIDV